MLMDLVVEARRQGVLVYVDAGSLKARSAGDALTPALKERVSAYKIDLIELLARVQPTSLDDARLQAQEAFWIETLAAAPLVHEIPLDAPRGVAARIDTIAVDSFLDAALCAGLDSLASRLGKDRFHLLHAAFAVLVARWSGRADMVIGSRLPQRLHPEHLHRTVPCHEILPVAVAIAEDATLDSVLAGTSAALADAHRNGDLPAMLIADLLKLDRGTQHPALMQLLFVEHDATQPDAHAGWPARFDIAASVRALPDGGLALDWTFDGSLFVPETIESLSRSFARLLDSLLRQPGQALAALDIVAEEDWSRITRWNSTGRPLDRDARLHDLFQARVAAAPESIALVHENQHTSYATLHEQAQRLAVHLQSLGVGPGSVVAICLPRTPELIVGILGVLMAGGAYLPIDPGYPQKRIAYILDDSAACVLLAHSRHLPPLQDAAIVTVCVDQPGDFASVAMGAAAAPETTADDLAYLIYTSGSTGKPKGVALEQRGAVNLHANQVRHFGACGTSRVLQFASIGFDAATWEWVMALLSGGTLFLCPDELRASATGLADYLVEQRITHATLPPALLTHLDPDRDYALEALIVAGEACPEPLRETWAGKWPMFNAYGPSETTVCATVERLQADGRVSIGRPLDNVQTYVMDDRLQLAPVGAVGELMIGGVALARGYVGKPELTAQQFVECSLRSGHRQRLYRSGDLVRYLPDGRLDFIGRKDDQIKLRGFRIEPREIEEILGAQAGVAHATVALRQSGRASSLAAYVVPASAMGAAARQALGIELLQQLAGQLPDYMVPSSLLVVEAFPLTPNGKIDKPALLSLDAAGAGHDMAAASTEVERALEAMWCELLKLDQVGIHDNFFAIGGDSILSIQAVARANQAGIPVTIRQFFEHTTIAAIVADLARSAPAFEPVGEASGEMPLVPIQARLLGGPADALHHFNQSILLHAPADLDQARLQDIAAALVARHDALRLTFPLGDDGNRHAIHRNLADFPVGETVRVETMDDTHASFAQFVHERADLHQRGFSLDRAPLFRMVYLQGQGQGQHRLLLIAHHLVIDGVSWRIILQDLETACTQTASGHGVSLPARTTSYQQWATALAAYAHDAALRDELPYWLEQAEPAPPAVAPDFDAPETPRHASTRYASIDIPEAQTRQLLRQCNQPYRTSINELLLTALHLGLRQFGNSGRLQLAVEGHGREPLFDRLDSSLTVGWFTSAFPLSLRVESAGIDAAIKSIKEQYRRIPRGGIGYGVLRYLAREEALGGALSQEPQILFNYLGQFDSALGDEGAFGFADEDIGSSVGGARHRDHALGINGLVSGGKLRFTIDYSDQQFRAETIERLAQAFREGLSAVIEHCLQAQPALTPSDFPLARVSMSELDGWQQRHDIARLYPATPMQHGLLFHTLVDAQAYTSQIALSLDGPLQPELMRQAWQAVAHRHDVLRTAIVDSEGAPHQLVVQRIELPWEEIDLRHLPEEAQEAEYARYRRAQRHQGFDLETPPLMRLSLFRLDETRYRLLWSHHHMLLDGWSLPMVYTDVMEHYEALLADRLPDVQDFRPYEDYVAWLQRQDTGAARDYWRDYLRDVESPTPLSVDKLPAEAARQPRFVERALSVEATVQLQELARRTHTTLYTVLQYAWGWLLHKYSGESTVVFGAILSGRPAELAGVERMVGLFINTLPVKVVLDPTQRVEDALAELHRAFQQSAHFGYLPLAEIRRQTGLPVGSPFFDSLLVLENYPLDEAIVAESRTSLVLSGVDAFEETDYKLTLNATLSDRLRIRCGYHSDVMGDRVIERLLGHLESILQQLPSQQVPAGIQLLAPQERQALEQWRTAEQPGRPLCIHQRFERSVRSTPDAVALVFQDESLTYAELNARANRLARALRDKGVGAETLVGLCVERGVQLVVGVLGILKAGGAYVPFDPATPRARLDYLLQDSAVGIVVSERATMDVLPEMIADLVLLDDESLADRSGEDLPISGIDAGPSSAAYVIYTSGSTGKPKGCVVEHRHVDRLFTTTERHFGFDGRDVWTLFHSYAFDFSVWEIWGALFHGGKLVVVSKTVARSPELFHELVCKSAVTVLNQTPAAFEQFARVDERSSATSSLRYVIFGGAALDYQSLKSWMQRHPDMPRMINMYGITETTVHVTFREVTRNDVEHGRGSMIGWPLADLTAVVLDPQGQPLPIGVAGELYVGGAGVSRGYLDRPELTAERFVADPAAAGEVLYRTGDLVRRHESGELEYLGRIDSQVKIRGFRIELGEIESEFNRIDLVRESLVLVQGDAADKRLIAYVVANEAVRGDADPRECSDRIRASLSQVLPEYMVPAVIMVIEAFPLNINGKIDRAALPSPDAGVSAGGWAEPRNETQRQMATIWQEVLGLARVGIDDNFFAIGGDSIRAIPLVSRLKQAGFALSIKDLFEAPTIAMLSQRTDGGCEETAAADLAPFALVDTLALEALGYRLDDDGHDARVLRDAYPMTALQQGMVFHNLLSADGTAYHDVMSFHVRTPWDAARFQAALQRLTDRHEILRTVFNLVGETPLQLVLARYCPMLDVIDLRQLERDGQELAIAEAVKSERSSAFDPDRPSWRVLIHLRGPAEFQYTLSFHHALMDGWSVANLNTQLFNGYLGKDVVAVDTPGHLPFRHYVQVELEAVRNPAVRQAWRERLEGAELPWWAGKPKRQTLNAMQRLEPAVSQGLVQLAQRLGVQERSVLLTVHVVLMALLDGRTDVVTSVVSNGRPEREGADSTLGLFLNSLPFRLEVRDESWEQLARRVDREVAAYYDVRHLPLAEIQAESGLDFSASLFNYTNFHVYQSLDEQLDVLGAQGAEEKNYAISLSFSKAIGTQGPQFDVSIDVDSSLFPESFFQRIQGYVRSIAACMAGDGSQRVSLDRLTGDDERETQLHQWNDNGADFRDLAVHRWFESQAQLTPAAVAVTYGAQRIDYLQLNLRANRVAHALIARGTASGQCVGLCVQNSIEMMVGILGILKAGAAYVPLDPAHPRDRTRQVVDDSGMRIVLSQRHLQPSLDQVGVPVLALDEPDWYQDSPDGNVAADPGESTHAPAYVVYTSGSTGRPKGVVVGHRALAMYLSHALATYHAAHIGGSLVVTSFAFDLTKPALFLPLLTGGSVDLLDAIDPLTDLTRRIADLAAGDRLVRATPMHVQAMLDLLPGEWVCPSRHAFVIGGEAFPPGLAAALRQRFPQSAVYNHYGPSESVVGCAMFDVTAHPASLGETLPIGRGMANTAVYVLNERLEPAPLGVPGILHVAGEGLADGYLGQRELTDSVFLRNPFADAALSRMYRTGDRVRYGEDGNLLFLGRADDQVKLRGFRIELGEIESQLRQLPFVKEAVVVAKGAGADMALVAYVVAHPDAGLDESAVGDAVKTALRARLPEYMVPAAVMTLQALPLSGNGKIDRRRLPEPDWGAGRAFVPPEGDIENRLARTWADILRSETVGATDNFFDLGGHSLKATRLVSAISREFAIDLPLVQVFQAPTLRDMARQIQQQRVRDENRAAIESMPDMTEMEW